jgi:hypothetical protein
MVARIASDRITLSTVAVGADADTELLARIAAQGGGRYYAASDPRSVPRIFMTETILVSRGLLIEKRFLPAVWSASEIVSGIDPEGIPPMDGFVLTYAKTGAEKVLSALYDAPLLAAWHYGLGRSAAFTGDLRGRWGRAWTAWDAFPRFAAQLVRWVERPGSTDALHPQVTLAAGDARAGAAGAPGGRGTIRVDAVDELGSFINGLPMTATVAGPGQATEDVALAQSGPGAYEGTFRSEAVGDYVVTVSAPSGGGLLLRTVGASRPYAEEYRLLAPDTRLLAGLAASAGGRLLPLQPDEESLAALLAREPAPAAAAGAGGILSAPGRASPWLVAAALLLFVLDIAARKLVLSPALRERLAPLVRLVARGGSARGRSYDEIVSMVARAREEEKKQLGERVTAAAAEGRADPDLAAYLYIARLRGRRSEGQERKSK